MQFIVEILCTVCYNQIVVHVNDTKGADKRVTTIFKSCKGAQHGACESCHESCLRTVKPLLSGRPLGNGNWTLNRGWPLNRGLSEINIRSFKKDFYFNTK